MNRYLIVALQIASMHGVTYLPFHVVNASGQYNHIHMANTAIDKVGNSEIKGILQDHRELFKFASLFPDTYGYDTKGPDGGHKDSSIVHSPAFFDQYARAIHDECFLTPVGTSSCSFRPDIECDQFTIGNCDVVGPRVCSKDATSCSVDILHPVEGDCNQDDGLNICADRGVCSDDFTTKCAQVIPSPQCPGTTNECFDNYGFCQPNFDTKCERLVTHFMGALAHLVTDINADKYFMRTVFERRDCPGRDFGDETTSDTNPAQAYTDQEMDGYLGRASIGRDTPLHDLLPNFEGRLQVEDPFLRNEVLEKIRGFNRPEQLTNTLDKQFYIGMPNKTDDDGNLTQTFLCTKGRKVKEVDDLDCEDKDKIKEFGIECKPFTDASSCDVRECTEKQANGMPNICRKDDDCPGDGNECKESNAAGVCTAGPEGEYVTPCREDSDCGGIVGGVFNTCSKDYGHCSLARIKRKTCHEDCKWALEEDHWYTEAGGTDDTAREIAKMIDEAWLPMRRGAILKFRRVGKFPDTHLCVGTTDKDCLQEKSMEIIGTAP